MLEYLTFRGGAKADKLDAEQYTLHFAAFLCFVTSAIVFALLRGVQVNPPPSAEASGSEEQLLQS